MDMEQAAVGLLIAIFSRPGSALLLAMGIFAFALAVLAATWWREVRPLTGTPQERARAEALTEALDAVRA